MKIYPAEVYNQSSERMPQVPSQSVDLVITSPPYNVGVDYAGYNDLQLTQLYVNMLSSSLSECYRVLRPGGRICINVANLERKPYRPLVNLLEALLVSHRFILKGEIIWHKWDNANSTAWGSWLSASSPALRDTHEYILVGAKGTDPLVKPIGGEMTLEREEFIKWTNSVWKIRPASRPDHPAIFPREIPERLIKLLTWTHSTVLDPFAGSGTTLVTARELGRKAIGYELSEEYFSLIKSRVSSGVQSSLEGFWESYFSDTDVATKETTENENTHKTEKH